MKEYIAKEPPLGEKIIVDIIALLMENIFTGGIYRQVRDFYADLTWKENGTRISSKEIHIKAPWPDFLLSF